MKDALLHSVNGGRSYHVEYGGGTDRCRFRDPEHDLARALQRRGIAGTIKFSTRSPASTAPRWTSRRCEAHRDQGEPWRTSPQEVTGSSGAICAAKQLLFAKSRERPSINQVGRATTPGCLDAYDAINQAGRDATFFFSLSLSQRSAPAIDVNSASRMLGATRS